jgi:phosphoenolpyruvate carboxykinase (GTP)
MTGREKLMAWVEEVRALCQPKSVHLCDGSREEYEGLLEGMVQAGSAIRLNQKLRPGCYLFRSDPSDVARVEERTFVSTDRQEDAGANNNWLPRTQTRHMLTELFRGCMRGRVMYVIPFVMGPLDSPFSMAGVEITDSPYVTVHMRLMTRMGKEALAALDKAGSFVLCLHSVGRPLAPGEADMPWPCAPMDRKYIVHFPQDRSVWSYGSGYGGNALLGKKCLALRLASKIAQQEGWLAEHMLIMKLTNPGNRSIYLSAAFPSACGKTNLAMMVPALPGWRVETLGDDIAWLRAGPDGSLRAVNPEAGFFGVAPGTSWKTNPNAMATIQRDTLFTNVALTPEGDVWWEGMSEEAPDILTDWRGQAWTPKSPQPAAHPNARFTAPARNCPCLAPEWETPEGVPISAILLGGRRPHTLPLLVQSGCFAQGVFLGSFMGSEITAALISDRQGQVRRDPFAMLPFIGYPLGAYLSHWLNMEQRLDQDRLPLIFHVNWFRKGADGRFLWPGFGQNIRVLKWVFGRALGQLGARISPIGWLPAPEDLDLEGLENMDAESLLQVDYDAWRAEAAAIRAFYDRQGDIPDALWSELEVLEERLA